MSALSAGRQAAETLAPVAYGEETTFSVRGKLDAMTPVILPLGAIEAHGPHLPLETDNLLAERYGARLAAATGGYVLPVLPFGQVFSLGDFPGSLSVSNESLSRIVAEVGEGLYRQGVRILVLFSAHLGNMVAMKDAARRLFAEHKDYRVLHMFYPDLQKLAVQVREGPSAHATYVHACEIETSLMLYLAPEHVDMSKAINVEPVLPPDADYTPTLWSEFSDTAVLGDAKLATYKKGKFLVEETLKRAVALVEYEKGLVVKRG